MNQVTWRSYSFVVLMLKLFCTAFYDFVHATVDLPIHCSKKMIIIMVIGGHNLTSCWNVHS